MGKFNSPARRSILSFSWAADWTTIVGHFVEGLNITGYARQPVCDKAGHA
jgi:hypothetical protein